MQCCNKHVIIYSGARVSELIRAIRSFISIDSSDPVNTSAESCNLATGQIIDDCEIHAFQIICTVVKYKKLY